jgi:lycopene cyclase domain-containing protein
MNSSAYLFLELALLVFVIGFGWEHCDIATFRSRSFVRAAFVLATIWFVIDEVAVHLDLWTFPESGTLPVRLFSLPIEEYVLFYLHAVICLVWVRQLSRARR